VWKWGKCVWAKEGYHADEAERKRRKKEVQEHKARREETKNRACARGGGRWMSSLQGNEFVIGCEMSRIRCVSGQATTT
jgi:hypothetical protein